MIARNGPALRVRGCRLSARSAPDGAGAAQCDSALGLGALLLPECVDLALEVLDALEALVHAGEADVGDLIQRVELLHRELADARRRHLGHALAAELRLDLVRRLLGRGLWNGPAGEGLAKAVGELVAIKFLAGPIAL